MRHSPLAALALLVCLSQAKAAGLLIPVEKSLPPLAMLNHKVTITIEDQAATTFVEQTFRNHTDRQLEATYIFPVPRGASVDEFRMTVDGKDTKGELLPADKAREIYNGIVRRTLDPGLLEHAGQDLFRMKVFPVPARGDQKVSIRFRSLSPKEGKLVQYTYPLKNDGKAVTTLDKFSITATVKSMHGVTNVYSPTHSISLRRESDKEVRVNFDKDAGALDRDFVMYYSTSKDDIGLTAIMHRPISTEKGFATLLVTPKFSLGEKYRIPQDIVLVLDTSGSMRGPKMDQARKALHYCLGQLRSDDRFGLVNFATGADLYETKLSAASDEQLKKARKWVDDLEATGGTNIDAALEAALGLRQKGSDRPFTVVFFTDGQPTFGEMDPEKIFKNTAAKNTENTRVFTFGVGDDVNTALLDRLAATTRAISAYVRPEEKIEEKVSSLYGKMSNPVLTNLKIVATGDVKLSEVYPIELPDLFHGGQVEVMCRFTGKGPSALILTGKVGKEEKKFVYDMTFPEKSDDGKDFVENLWARRKVGALLDQIRIKGENAELKNEVILLAKKYGITTPYTSWLIVPDGVTPGPLPPGKPGKPIPIALGRPGGGGMPPGAAPKPVLDFAKDDTDRFKTRARLTEAELKEAGKRKGGEGKKAEETLARRDALEKARTLFGKGDKEGKDAATTGKLGVDIAVEAAYLRTSNRTDRSAIRNTNGRRLLEVGGVWIDEAFTAKTDAIVIKAMSDAYFDILAAHPEMKGVFQTGNHLIWVTPSGKALVIDASHGKETLKPAEIKALFASRK